MSLTNHISCQQKSKKKKKLSEKRNIYRVIFMKRLAVVDWTPFSFWFAQFQLLFVDSSFLLRAVRVEVTLSSFSYYLLRAIGSAVEKQKHRKTFPRLIHSSDSEKFTRIVNRKLCSIFFWSSFSVSLTHSLPL